MPLLGIPRAHLGLVVLALIGGGGALGWSLVFARISPVSVWGLCTIGFALALVLVFAERPAALFPIVYAAMWIPLAFVLYTVRNPPYFELFLFYVLPYTWGPFLLGVPLAIVRTAGAFRNGLSDSVRAQT